MADYTIRVEAQTREADEKLKRLDRNLNEVERSRKINLQLPSLQDAIDGVETLGKALNTTYSIARNLPVVGGRIQDVETVLGKVGKTGEYVAKSFELIKAASPGQILTTSFRGATGAIDGVAKSTASLGYTVFGVTQSVSVLRQAFGGFFDETIGREVRLQEALLRTKTTLVSTADVAANGKRITDPYQAIMALEGPINQTIESIRARSLDIAGTTSDAIVQVFGVVASQIASVGGSLKDAEDLAISFSAALGTMGLSDPMYATQEIRSILTGNIDQNSVLARSLGLTNEEIQKAKTSAEGLIGFLQRRLSAFTAGQSIAAKSFGGIISNIQEFREEISRAFGRSFLAPLLDGLTVLYQRLQLVFKSSFGIADALGKSFSAVGRGVVGAAAAAPSLAGINQRDQVEVFKGMEQGSVQLFLRIQEAVDKLRPQIALLVDQFVKGIAQISGGLTSLLKGFASFKFEQFKIYITALTGLGNILNSTVIPALTKLLEIYGAILANPFAQYLSQVAANFKILNDVGVLPLIRTLYILPGIFESLKVVFGWITTAIRAVGTAVSAAFSGIAGAVAGASAGLAALGKGFVSLAAVVSQALLGAVRIAIQTLGVFLVDLGVALQATAPQFGELAVSISSVGKAFLNVDKNVKAAQLGVAQFALRSAEQLGRLEVKAQEVAGAMRNIGTTVTSGFQQAAGAVSGFVGNWVVSTAKFLGGMLAWQLAFTLAFDLMGRWQRRQQEISDQTRSELAIKRLSTVYAEVGENATAATKAAKAFEEQIVSTRTEELTKKMGELDAAVKRVLDVQQAKGFAGAMRQLAAGLNLNNLDVRPQKTGAGTQETQIQALLRTRREELVKVRQEYEKLSKFEEQRKQAGQAQEDVQLLAKERRDIETRLAEERKQLTREIVDKEFSLRQQYLRTEQSIYEARRQLDQNALDQKLRQEQQGLSGVRQQVAQILGDYEKSLFNAQTEAQKRQFDIARQRETIEKEVSDYKLKLEDQTYKLRIKLGEYNKKVADYEASERIRSAKAVLDYAMRAAALQAEGFIVTPEERDKFMNAAAQKGVSATRSLALLKTGAASSLGIAPGASPSEVIDKLVEQFGAFLKTDGGSFEQALNARTKAVFGQGTGGTYAIRAAEAELGSRRFIKSAPTAAPKVQGFTEYAAVVESTVGRLKTALDDVLKASIKYANESFNVANKLAANEVKNRLLDPGLYTDAPAPEMLRDNIDALRTTIVDLADAAKAGSTSIDPLTARLRLIEQNLMAAIDQVAKAKRASGTPVTDEMITYSKDLARRYIRGQATLEDVNNTFSGDGYGSALKYTVEGAGAAAERERSNAPLNAKQLALSMVKDLQQAMTTLPDTMAQETATMFAEIKQLYAQGDPVRQRLAVLDAELEQLKLRNKEALNDPEALAQFKLYSDAARANAIRLGELAQKLEQFQMRIALINEAARSLTEGAKGMVSSVLQGGNLTEAVSEMGRAVGEKFLGMALDYAFAPIEKLLQEQFKQFLMPEDPTLALQRENNTALGLNTGTLDRLASALTTRSQILPELPAASPHVLPGLSPSSPHILPGLLPSGGELRPLPITPFIPSGQLSTLTPDSLGQLAPITENGSAFAQTLDDMNKSLEQAPLKAQEANKGFQSFLGGMAGVAAGAMSIAGGIQQLSKGGTSNTLAGIGSIFLGLGSAIGGFGGMGLFGKKAGGGAVSSARPYMVGESGPELFIPSTGGNIHSNQSLREAMGGSSTNSSNAPVLNMSFQSTNIGGVEYVSRDQLEAAMAATRREASRDGAKRGMSMTLDKLQQSPGTRNRVGLR